MARTYRRDARGRFAGGGSKEREVAPRRINYAVTYHGTSNAAAGAIRSNGHKSSTDGPQGAAVYTTRSRKMANIYTPGYGKGANDVVLRYRVPQSRLSSESIGKYGNMTGRQMDAAIKRSAGMALKRGRAYEVRGTREIPNSLKPVVMTAAMANKALVRQPTIKARRGTRPARRRRR